MTVETNLSFIKSTTIKFKNYTQKNIFVSMDLSIIFEKKCWKLRNYVN